MKSTITFQFLAVPSYIPQNDSQLQLELVAMNAKDFAKQLDTDFRDTLGCV